MRSNGPSMAGSGLGTTSSTAQKGGQTFILIGSWLHSAATSEWYSSTFNLFSHMTALGNVMEGPVTVKRIPKAEAEKLGRDLLARVGLADKEDEFPLASREDNASGSPSPGRWR